MDSKRFPKLINLGILAVMLGGSLALWPRIPDRVPTHFDLYGCPDGWSGRGTWWALPAVAVGLSLFMFGIAWLIRRYPHLINIPRKKEFLALPPDMQEPVITGVETFVHWMYVPLNLMWVGAQTGVYLAATDGYQAVQHYLQFVFWGAVAAVLIMTVVFVSRLNRMIRESTRKVTLRGGS